MDAFRVMSDLALLPRGGCNGLGRSGGRALGNGEVGENLTFAASPVLSLRPAPGQHSARLVAHTGGKTSGREGDFNIVKSKREVGQKHFFLGLETSINIRCRGSTLLVYKGESFERNI